MRKLYAVFITATQPEEEDWRTHWVLGLFGFLSVLGVLAFSQNEPVFLFWFTFAAFFSAFRRLWEPLKYLGLLGVLGFILAILGLIGFVTV